jgi:hypothetical protein
MRVPSKSWASCGHDLRECSTNLTNKGTKIVEYASELLARETKKSFRPDQEFPVAFKKIGPIGMNTKARTV